MHDFTETLRTLTAVTLLALIVASSFIGARLAMSFLETMAVA